MYLAAWTLLAFVLALAGLLAARARRVARLEAAVTRSAPPVTRTDGLPEPVRAFALRSGARPDALVHLAAFAQVAEMRLKPDRDWQAIAARQVIATGAPGFAWRAQLPWGPVSKFEVVDAYSAGQGKLAVHLLGLIPVLRAGGPDIDRAEAMRYLAELPWAPDAILGNPAISWRQIDDTRVEARLDGPDWQAAVEFRFDAGGDVVEVFAPDRPATGADGRTELLPWRGSFRDYRRIGPRRIPVEAEVGYVHPEGYRPYFRGRITQYSVRA